MEAVAEAIDKDASSELAGMLTIIVAVVALALMLLLLGAIIRYSIVSPRRTRGMRNRLGQPDPAGVERVCGFPPSAALVYLYREGSLTRLVEFSLVDRQLNRTWVFGTFYPLTGPDVLEQRKVHGLTTGIPIADDMDKGVYYATRDGRIMLRSGGRNNETEVAPSADVLSRFDLTGGSERKL